MVIDVIIGIIVIGTMAWSFHKGFVHTFLRTIDWVLAIVAAFLWSSKLGDFLMEKTDIYSNMLERTQEKFQGSMESATSGVNSLPSIFGDFINNTTQKIATDMAIVVTDRIYGILCFALIVIGVKLVIFALITLLSKENNEGFLGFTDGIAGMIIGFVKGMILVFLLLALMLPAVNMLSPEHTDAVMKSLDNSYYAGELYDNNFLLLIVRDFFHLGV